MTARFAGSRSLDERRRRRIAGEQDDYAFTATSPASGNDFATPAPVPPPTPRRKTRRLSLRLIVSPKIWKHVAVGLFLLAAAASVLWAGVEAEAIGQQAGPELQRLVSLQDGKLAAAFGSVMLFLSAQLAMLIGFVRARSHTDFSGRYRIWGWAALVGFIASACAALDLHLVWSRSLAWWLQMDFQKLETLCWLAPAVGCGSVLIRDLMVDMRNCRASSATFWLTLICWTVSCVQILGYGVALPERFAPLATTGAAMIGHVFLFISLTVHSRFVIFINAEPPKLRPPLWKSAIKRTVAWLSKHRAVRQERKQQAKSEREKLKSENSKKKTEPAKTPSPKPVIAEKPAVIGPAKATKPVEREEVVAEETKAAVESKSGKKFRFDQPHELEEVAGMSKRERRRLRKLQKQRSHHDADD